MSRIELKSQVLPYEGRSTTDQVYDVLYRQVLTLELPPDTKMSEAEVAKKLGVSRQPVRDAFFRLSNLGFLQVRPQKATRVTKICVGAIDSARFVRTAIEVEVVRRAVAHFGAPDYALLEENLAQQKQALEQNDHQRFHQLDNAFHQLMCERAQVGFAWDFILENKAHTDRVRFLSLATGSARALGEHQQILQALKERDLDAAVAAMRHHLSQIQSVIEQLRQDNHHWFSDEEVG